MDFGAENICTRCVADFANEKCVHTMVNLFPVLQRLEEEEEEEESIVCLAQKFRASFTF